MASGNKRYFIHPFTELPILTFNSKPNYSLVSFYMTFNYTFRRPDIIGASYTSLWQDHPYFVDSGDKDDRSDTLSDVDRKCKGDTSR